MDKLYNRINWANEPNVSTPLSEVNLNKMDSAINTIDDRIIAVDIKKANQSDLLQCIKGVTYNTETGVFVFTWQNGTTMNVDLAVEKIPVSMSMSADGIITMITADGTQFTCNVKELIKDYQFVESEQIHFDVSTDAVGNYTIAANIKDGTITGNKLEPDYLANITVHAQNAAASASSAAQSANSAAVSADEAQTWAGQAQSLVGVGIATAEKAGFVKPSERVTVAADGTMGVNLQDIPVLSSGLMTGINVDDNLDNYLMPGRYICSSDGITETLINIPDIKSGFYLDVYEWTSGSVSQVVEQCHSNVRYKRAKVDGTWKAWEKVPQREEINTVQNSVDTHISNTVYSSNGVHGLRQSNGTLQMQDESGNWINVKNNDVNIRYNPEADIIEIYYNGEWCEYKKANLQSYNLISDGDFKKAAGQVQYVTLSIDDVINKLSITFNKSGTGLGSAIVATKAIDLTGYSKIVVSHKSSISQAPNIQYNYVKLLVTTNLADNPNTVASTYLLSSQQSVQGTVELDVSALGGNYYVCLLLSNNSNVTRTEVTEMYLI